MSFLFKYLPSFGKQRKNGTSTLSVATITTVTAKINNDSNKNENKASKKLPLCWEVPPTDLFVRCVTKKMFDSNWIRRAATIDFILRKDKITGRTLSERELRYNAFQAASYDNVYSYLKRWHAPFRADLYLSRSDLLDKFISEDLQGDNGNKEEIVYEAFRDCSKACDYGSILGNCLVSPNPEECSLEFDNSFEF